MSVYNAINFKLTNSQKEAIKKAYLNKTGVTISINKSQMGGSDTLGLTKTQISKLRKSKKAVTLKLSKTQVQKQGGFLGALASLVTRLAPTVLKSVLPTLGLAAASGALHGATSKAVAGRGRKGKGLILGPNSPFKNIPILGAIL